MKIEDMIARKRADCTGCEACANACPKHAIDMMPDAEGFFYPKLDKSRCVQCGQCDASCPVLNAVERPTTKLPQAFAAVNGDWNVRRNSSSGGAFSALASVVLKRGGLVFGAAFNSDWQVEHIAASSMAELVPIRGSKYVQSRIGEVYRRIKRELEDGREVLFSGTPCQVAGLKYYLRQKDYPRLTLVDIICKGVTPPVLWKHYIAWQSRGHEIVDVTFRDKQFGWQNPLLKIIFRDRGMYSTEHNRDIFGQGFGLAVTLRPSCSECHFKGVERLSDLTLADFWGASVLEPSMYDNRGTSLVIVHSEKGARLLVETKMIMKPTDLRRAIEYNPCLIASFPAEPRRTSFFKDLAMPKADPIAVMDKYYLQQFAREAQQSSEKLAWARQQKWAAIENQLALTTKPQPTKDQPSDARPTEDRSSKEKILIVTLPSDWVGGSNRFLDQYRAIFGRFLTGASKVYSPSSYAANIIRRFLPDLTIEIRPHRLFRLSDVGIEPRGARRADRPT